MAKKTVVVGLSGGVDSSVSAYLLKEAGYDVKALFMKNWQSEPGEVCTSEIDFKDASDVCDKLDIPLHKANFSDEYWDRVFTNFLSEHEKGRTPNPDILCNREIKFKSFLDYAFEIGADYIATGHYAKILVNNSNYELHKADYLEKDQSYVLHMLSSETLEHVIFPLGTISKPEVRQIAAELGLKTAFKKDSQDICFVGKKNYRDFVDKRIDISTSGEIINSSGEIMGNHEGVHEFTVGQRKGIPGGQGSPKYVTKIDVQNKKVYVGNKNELLTSSFYLEEVSFVNEIQTENLSIQTRYNSDDLPCSIEVVDGSQIKVLLNEPTFGVAPGQFGVLYSGTKLVGGGRITTKLNEKLSV